MLFGCPRDRFGPLSRGRSQSPDVNLTVLSISSPTVTGSLVKRLHSRPGRAPSGVWTGDLLIHSQRFYLLDHSLFIWSQGIQMSSRSQWSIVYFDGIYINLLGKMDYWTNNCCVWNLDFSVWQKIDIKDC